MKLKVAIYKKISFFARACKRAGGIFILAIVVVAVHSTVLIHAGEKTSDSIKRLRRNQISAKTSISGAEQNLISALQSDASSLVRQSAAQQLGNYSQNPLVVRALAEALRDDAEKSVRYASALSLGLSPTFKAIIALERAANDPDADLRRQIAFSLKRHRVGQNKVKANQILRKLQRDPDLSVRSMATEAAQ